MPDGSLTTQKYEDGSVTLQKIDTTSFLYAKQTTTTASWSQSTSFSDATAAITLEPGTWLIMTTVGFSASLTAGKSARIHLYNKTAAETISADRRAYLAGSTDTAANYENVSANQVVTLEEESEIVTRASVSSTSGSTILAGVSLVALRIGALS